MPKAMWEKLQQSVMTGMLAFSAFWMWNAGQTMVLLDYRMNKVEISIERLER